MDLNIFFKDMGEIAIPIKYQEKIKVRFMKAGFTDLPLKFIGGLFLFNIIFSIIMFFAVLLPKVGTILMSLVALIGLFVGLGVFELLSIYFYLDLKIFQRITQIEDQLDRFLQQVSDSLKGGLTFDKALWSSAKTEFGVLSQEIKMVAKTATTGKDIEGALKRFMDKYNSPTIRRTFSLIAEGIKGGGKITTILDRIVMDLRETRKLNKEMRTAVLNYIIFISIIIMVVAPGLFAVSGQLLNVLSQFVESLASSLTGAGSVIPFQVSEVSVTAAQFTWFSSASLSVISIFSAMIISIITKSNIKSGLRYIPMFWAISLASYWIMATGLGAVFSAFT